MKKLGKSILEVFQKIRGAFRTQSDIHDGALLQKLQLKFLNYILTKSAIVDVRLSFKYASEDYWSYPLNYN